MDRQGIEQLVRQRRAALPTVGREVRLEAGSEARRGEPPDDRAAPLPIDLDRHVDERGGEGGRARDPSEDAAPGDRLEDAQGQGARPGAVIADDEPAGRTEPSVDLVELAGDRGSEDRMGLGRRQEVAGAGWLDRPTSGSSPAQARTGPWP